MTNSIFVTVGSTRFDKLIAAVLSPALLQLLHSLNFTHLTIQHGQSPITATDSSATAGLSVEAYKYKPSLREDMEGVDLVISHAGSGSILEALRQRKKLIVVVNEDLMDNHQLELGSALHEQGYLVCCNVSDLESTLRAKEYDSLSPFPQPDPTRFSNFLDSRMGL